MEGKSGYHPDVRVRIIGEQPFFGPGTAQLLRCIRQCGSVAAACHQMQLSYSKGRAMVRRLEAELAVPIVRRSKGGPGGGNAVVTPEGERLLALYTCYEERIHSYAQREFDALRELLPQKAQ